ncbi:MAG TPA: cytochrome D1 domain-containing protein [Steroidobacteraceae bacterium]|nr:cytochrome D1 domain-containing protein [Steroidobacteraceae bacterium]
MRTVTGVGAFPQTLSTPGPAARFGLRAALLTVWLALAPLAEAARAYVSNEDDGTVTVVDTDRLAAVGTIAVGKRPRGLALSRDGKRLYVALSGLPKCPPPMTDADCARLPRDTGADGIAVVDTGTLRPIGTLRGVSDPERVQVSEDGRTLYVSEEDAARLAMIDVAHAAVLGTVAVGREPEGVRVSPDGRWVLVTSEEDNAVAIIDAHKRIRHATAAVGQRPRDVVSTPDGRTAYVSGEADASVFRIAVPAGSPATQLLQLRGGARPMGLALDARAGRLYVSTGRAGSVAVIAIAEARVVAEVAVGVRPWGIALAEDGAQLLTANGPGADLTVVDTRTLSVAGRIGTGRGSWGVVAGP